VPWLSLCRSAVRFDCGTAYVCPEGPWRKWVFCA
jgi:hypothetical protein